MMAFWRRKKKELTLEDRILRVLIRDGALDWIQICVEVGEYEESTIKTALITLVQSEHIEPRLDPGQTEETDFQFVPWGLSTGFRKRIREQRKAHALRVLGEAAS